MASPDDGAGDQPRREKKTHAIDAKQCLLLAKQELPPDVYKEFVKTMTEIWKQNCSADSDGVLRNVPTENCIETVVKQLQGWDAVKQGFLNFTQGRSPIHDNPIPLRKPIGFLQRVKRCPGISEDDYNALLQTMIQYSKEKTIDAKDVYLEVKEFLRNSPELLEEFIKNYLPPGLTVLLSDEQYCRCLETTRVRKGALHFTPAGNHSLEGIRVKATNRRKVNEESLLAEEYEGDKVEPLPDSRDKELPPKVDLNICKPYTPSYRLLPKNCITLQSSYQTKEGRSVLNDDLVCVTYGSEDHDHSGIDGGQDRKSGTKNKYEEDIFRAENDMFESDMLLQWFSATADFLATLQYRVGSDMKIQEHLTPLHRRCIERLYDNYGLTMVDEALSESGNASAVLAVLLTRFKQKIKDLSEARLSLHKTCSDIIAENHYRSLDYRGPSFKQLDTKRLRKKALLAEANEINKTKLNAGDKYNDPHIHEDISSIISYACAPEDTEMMTWTKLVQPFLSVNCLWPELKENVVPEEACEHCGISKDHLNSIPDALTANKPPLSSKIGDFPSNKSKECRSSRDGLNAEIEEGEFVPDAENIHSGPSTCDHGNEPEEQHESIQDSKRTTKSSGVNGETCCSIVVLRRLYQILYDRLKVANSLSRDGAERLPRNPCARDLYEEFKEKLGRLLDRSIDHCKFENFCLKFLGSESFELFTLDRLINRVINQIRIISSSDEDNLLLQFLENLRRPTLPKSSSQHQNTRCSPTQPSNGLPKHDEDEKVDDPRSGGIGKPKQIHFQRRKRSKLVNGAESLSQPGVKDSNS